MQGGFKRAQRIRCVKWHCPVGVAVIHISCASIATSVHKGRVKLIALGQPLLRYFREAAVKTLGEYLSELSGGKSALSGEIEDFWARLWLLLRAVSFDLSAERNTNTL